MIIANQKKKENICEYLIYMFQVEDSVRSLNFDLNEIKKKVIERFDLPDFEESQVLEWYTDIVSLMKQEKITEHGHLNALNEIIMELTYLHNMQLNLINDSAYKKIYDVAKPNILELAKKSNQDHINEVEVCLNGLYGLFLLRIQKKQISQETQDAMNSFSSILAVLAKKYNDMKNGKVNLPANMKN